MAADIQHLPGVGPQLRLRGAGEGTFIVESHPPQRTPGVTGKGKHLLCRAEGDSPFLLGEGKQRLQSGQPLAGPGCGILWHHTGALRAETHRLPALAPQQDVAAIETGDFDLAAAQRHPRQPDGAAVTG